MQRPTASLIVLLTIGVLIASFAADAQQPTKVYRIGRLSSGLPLPEFDPLLEAFRQGLRELGYVEGQNLVIESRYAAGRAEQLPDLATELVQLKVDVIIAGGTAAVRAAQQATHTIPIVMTGSYDPVGEGFVASLAQPGGNITGLSFLGAELPGKRLELLKETVPQSRHIAVLWNPVGPGYASRKPLLHNLAVAARALELQLHVVELRRADELDSVFAAMTQAGVDAVIAIEDALLLGTQRAQVVADLAAKHRLPVMYSWREWAVAGCLMSYGPSLPDTYQRAATYVDKILKGAKPADLPVEQPTTFELVINLKTARALGLTISPTILFQANEVIQ